MTRCNEIQKMVWTEGPDAVGEAHLSECPDCAAEARRAGDLLAALRGMQSRFAAAPVALEADILAAVNRRRLPRVRNVVEHPRFRWGAAGAGAAAAATLGVLVARRITGRPELAAKSA